MNRFKILQNFQKIFHQHSQLSYFTVKDTLKVKPIGNTIVVKGWVQATRKHKNLYFVDLIDGTCLERLQIILPDSDKCPSYGSSIKVEGSLIKSSHKGQEVELQAENWSTYGSCPTGYPFEYRQKYSTEYIRQYLHLRPRTRRISSILRIRSNASMAVHQFFQNEGFHFIHTPIITGNDCEGAGEVFSLQLKEKSSNSPGNSDVPSVKDVPLKLEPNVEKDEESEEFFGTQAYLTVSGQLHLEAMACALSRVYNFGPVFRAESSQTRQHASEFHMVEAEVAFVDTVEELTKTAEKCIKYIAKSILDNCSPDLQFLIENSNNEEYLKRIITEQFVVMTYDEAVKILETNKELLQVPIKWGDDLVTNHKTFLTEYTSGIPVFVIMFPSLLKPFYMKTDESKTVAQCFDLFASYGGEICGGSLRENDEEILKSNTLKENSTLSWYLDLRKYGAVPHGGFGIGFDRLLQSLVGISNIRDIIPFPRRKNDCKC